MAIPMDAHELAKVEGLREQILAEADAIEAPCNPKQFRVFMRMATNPDNHVALGFSGGGVPGIAGNAALLSIIEDLDLKPHIKEVWGTSAGGIVGAALAVGTTSQEVLDLVEMGNGRKGVLDVPKWWLIRKLVGFLFKRPLPQGFVRGAFFDEIFRKGLKVDTFEEADIPLRLIACTDDGLLQKVIHRKGPILKAVQASMCLPGLMVPRPDWNGKDFGYYDGGLVENTPLVSVIDEHIRLGRKSDLLVLCTRFQSSARTHRPANCVDRILNSYQHLQDISWTYQQKQADEVAGCKHIIVNPHIIWGGMMDFTMGRANYLICRKQFKEQLSNAGLASRFGAH